MRKIQKKTRKYEKLSTLEI